MIHTFTSVKVAGWAGGSFAGLERSRPMDMAAFLGPQTSDVMAVGYQVPGEKSFPRLLLGAASELAAMGSEPVLSWMFIDVDRVGHTPWPTTKVEQQTLFAGIDWDHPAVSGAAAYTTRAGLRLLWRLEPALPVSRANGFIAAWANRVAEAIKSDTLAVDSTSAQWTRLFRVPYALRQGGAHQAVLAWFDEMKALNPWTTGLVPEPDTLLGASDWGDCPEEPAALEPEQLAAAWCCQWAVEGRPIPPDGEGHTYPTLKSSLASIAASGNIQDPHVLVSLVWDSVQATPNRTMAEAWKLACWVAQRQAAQHEAVADVAKMELPQKAHLPEVTDEMWTAVRSAFARNEGLYIRLRTGQVPSARGKNEFLPQLMLAAERIIAGTDVKDPRLVYAMLFPSAAKGLVDPDDLWKGIKGLFSDREAAGQDPAKVAAAWTRKNPLTIAIVGSAEMFQRDLSKPLDYVPVDRTVVYAAFSALTRPHLPQGVDIEYNGLDVPTIIERYGSWADRVEYVSGLRGTQFQRDKRVLRKGVHVLADCSPAMDPGVDRWLRALGASDPERFLDWLACVTYTQNQPLAALYLEGQKGAGKSLLLAGLASLWGTPPTDYASVGADFNAAILANPVLAADEGIQVKRDAIDTASEVFRNLVANLCHPVRAKFKADATLQGAVRVVIPANDGYGLPFKKALGAQGIEAITQRIIYLRCADDTSKVIEDLGGRAGVSDWVKPGFQPGKIASHLLWLRDTRKVEPGSRFLVEGVQTPWHNEFVASQGHKPDVLMLIGKLVKNSSAGRPDGQGAWLDKANKVVWVQASKVYDAWAKWSTNRRPSLNDITATLKMVASGEQERRTLDKQQVRVWPVAVATLVDAEILEEDELD